MNGPDDNDSDALDYERRMWEEEQDPEYLDWLADRLADLGERHTDYLEDR